MKKCCENKDDHLESNWCFDPCDKERGYKIKRLIDECSGDYIYPVTSLDSIIININTLDVDTKACLLSKQSDPCDRNVEITLRDLIESGCLVTGTECTELISGGKIILTKYGKYVLLLYYENGDTLDIDITDIFGDPFIDAVWNEDNNTLTLERNSGKNPFITLIKDKNQQIDKINYNSDGSVSIIQNNGDPTVISQNESKIFMPGYYRTILKYNPYILEGHPNPDPFAITNEQLPIDYNNEEDSSIANLFPISETDKSRYLGVLLSSNVKPTVWYPHIYKVISSTNYSLVLSLLLPHDDYVYVVSTGYCYGNPTGEIAYFYKEKDTNPVTNPNDDSDIFIPKLKALCNFRLANGYLGDCIPADKQLNPPSTKFYLDVDKPPFLFGPSLGAAGYENALRDSNYPNLPNYAPTIVINEDGKTIDKRLVKNRNNIYFFINILNELNSAPIDIKCYNRVIENNQIQSTTITIEFEQETVDLNENQLRDKLLAKLSDRYKYLFAFPLHTETVNGSDKYYITLGEQVLTKDLLSVGSPAFFTRVLNMYYDPTISGKNYAPAVKQNGATIDTYTVKGTGNEDQFIKNNVFRGNSNFMNFYDYATWSDNSNNEKRNLAISIILGFAFGSKRDYANDNLVRINRYFSDGVGWNDAVVLYNFKMYDSNIELMGKPLNNYWNTDDMIEHSVGTWLLNISNGEFTLNAKLKLDIGDFDWNITGNDREYYAALNLETNLGLIPHAVVTEMDAVCTHLVTDNNTTTVESTYIKFPNS